MTRGLGIRCHVSLYTVTDLYVTLRYYDVGFRAICVVASSLQLPIAHRQKANHITGIKYTVFLTEVQTNIKKLSSQQHYHSFKDHASAQPTSQVGQLLLVETSLALIVASECLPYQLQT